MSPRRWNEWVQHARVSRTEITVRDGDVFEPPTLIPERLIKILFLFVSNKRKIADDIREARTSEWNFNKKKFCWRGARFVYILLFLVTAYSSPSSQFQLDFNDLNRQWRSFPLSNLRINQFREEFMGFVLALSTVMLKKIFFFLQSLSSVTCSLQFSFLQRWNKRNLKNSRVTTSTKRITD